MKAIASSSPNALFTFFVGVFAATVLGHFFFSKPIVSEREKKFDVYLERIEVRDTDPTRWNLNGGYLDMSDAVFFDDGTMLALYSQDGMRISHDSGVTWKRLFEPSGVPKTTGGFPISDLEFTDRQHGWAGGACLIKTSDGGETWQNIKLPEWIDNLQIKFLNEKFGYVAGRGGYCEKGTGECDTWMSVYKTSDGGATWKRTLKTKEGDTPWEVLVISEDIAMVTFGGGWLYRTSDGGKSWQKVMNGFFNRVMSVSRAPDGKFWMFGKCSVLVSDDLGASWKTPGWLSSHVIHHEWSSVDLDEDGTGVAVSEDAAIAITRDGGASWKLATTNLHIKGEMPVPDNPFKEALRSIRLHNRRGIVGGSQRDYRITVPDETK